jgi:PAS domain S-box-containing protein
MLYADRRMKDTEGKYLNIYKHSAVSLWEEDISAVRSMLEDLRKSGITDIRGYLDAHIEFVQEAVRSITVIDVNDVTLSLYEADSREQLLGSLTATIDIDPIAAASLKEMIIAIDEGRKEIQTESTARTLRGNPLSLIVRSYIPAEDDEYPYMLVSLIDITQRKKAEAEVVQLQKRIEFILGAMKTGLDIIDSAYNLRYVDPEWSKVYGDPRGKKCYEYFMGAKSVCEKCPLPLVFNSKLPFVSEEVLPNEGNRIVQVTTVPFLDENGEWLAAEINVDITERKYAEAELLRERGLLTSLMDNLPDTIYFKDASARFIRINKALVGKFGLSDASGALGKTDGDFFSEAHARQAYEDEQGIMRTGTPLVDIEEKETWPDRHETWVLSTKMPLRDGNGDIIGTFGVSRDITERKRMEERNRQLAALVDSADDAILGLDLDDTITVWNKGAERIYGYTADEIVGQSVFLLIPAELADEARRLRERLGRGERIDHMETIRRRKDGALIDVSLTLSLIHNERGVSVGITSIARDITSQKAIQAQLQRAQRLESLATLAGGVAHQFNNINMVVKGYLDMLQEQGNLPQRLTSYAMGASKGLEKAIDITDRLLALTAPVAAALQPVRLETLTRSLLTLFEPRFLQEKAALVLQLEETTPVLADESRLLFVISSMIVNSLDALTDQPQRVITIRTGRLPNAAFLEVSDTGCGIPPENIPRLFTPFFTTKGEWASAGSPQAKRRGVGLSLAVGNVTVSEYGGRFEVRSAPGSGSTFRLLLPFAGKP